MTKYILPIFIIAVLILGFVKKVQIYDSFTVGAKESLKLVFSIFPFICAILILVELFRVSGLADATARLMSPVLTFLGIPPELTELIVIRPLSGNGSQYSNASTPNTDPTPTFHVARLSSSAHRKRYSILR